MGLNKEVKEILSIDRNKIILCYLLNVSYRTIHRWLKEDSEKLQLPRVVKAIVEVTGKPENELFEVEQKQTEALS